MVTLRPGRMGGSETYVRGLLRALNEYGELDYRPLVRGDADLGGLDAIHYPFTVGYPRTKLPAAVTVHDVLHREPLRSPRRLVRRFTYDGSSRRARLVIVPSEFVRGRTHDLLGIPSERIRVIYHGIDHDRFYPGDEPREGFLFYPAEPWPHKNHARLFEAFALLQRTHPELELVLTGYDGPAPDGVRVLGRVPPDELARLYRTASALVFPSLYEGFGLPPLEAMACGCPVAASAVGSLPEVCGDAAVLFDPYDTAAIAAGVEEALARASELSAAGPARAASFTWDATARAHDRVYELAARSR